MLTPRHSRPLISIPVVSHRTGERISIQLRLTPRPVSASVVWIAAAPDIIAASTTHHMIHLYTIARLPPFPRETQLTLSPEWLAVHSLSLTGGSLKHLLQQLSGLVRVKSEANTQHST